MYVVLSIIVQMRIEMKIDIVCINLDLIRKCSWHGKVLRRNKYFVISIRMHDIFLAISKLKVCFDAIQL